MTMPDRPLSREEEYLASIAGQDGVKPDRPLSRKEEYLDAIDEHMEELDDVLDYPTSADFPEAGEEGKIYVANDTNFVYRWNGSEYVQIGGGGGDSNGNIVYVKYDNANNRYDLTPTGDNNKNLCKLMSDYIGGKEDFLITFGMKKGEKEAYCIATEMKVDVLTNYVSFYILTVADRPDLSTGTSKYGMDYRDITPKHVTLYAPRSEYDAGKIEHLYSDTALTHQYFTLETPGRTLYGLWTNSTSKMPLAANNTASFTPTGDYNPATKKYVDDRIKIENSTPTTSTAGTLGQLYINTTDMTIYLLTNISGDTYTWTSLNI